MLEPTSEANVRAEHYSIVRAPGVCPRCGCRNELTALMVPPGHAVRDLEACSAVRSAGWEIVPCSAFLFHLERLAPAVEQRLCSRSARRGSMLRDRINRCTRCEHVWPEEELFCEPGGAFLPQSEAEAQRLAFHPVAEPLWGSVGGHAPDPMFVQPRFAR